MQLSSLLLHHTACGAGSKDTWLIAVDTTDVELMFFGNKSFLKSWKGDGVYNLNDKSAFGDIPLGILHASRASGKLFTAKFLTSGGTTAYPSISQKVLKGAAARMFIYWLGMILLDFNDTTHEKYHRTI